MKSIFKKELRSYFTSPLGFVLLAIFCMADGIFYLVYNLLVAYSNMNSLYQSIMTIILMIFAPILTMKLLSEEKKLKTDQLLLTSPVSVQSIVIGKFLSALVFFLICLSVTVLQALVAFMYGNPQIGLVIGNLLATTVVAAAFIAIGILISALTESQIIAAFASFGIVLLLYMMDLLVSGVTNSILSGILNWMSIYSRFDNFALGIFDITALVYYGSVVVVCLFLSVRVIEKRRYS
jgi:ABC-2 type transport system permease protein